MHFLLLFRIEILLSSSATSFSSFFDVIDVVLVFLLLTLNKKILVGSLAYYHLVTLYSHELLYQHLLDNGSKYLHFIYIKLF